MTLSRQKYLVFLFLFGWISQSCLAQFCNGATADTVIYNSFGTGDLPQPAVKGMVPGYFFDYYNRCPGPKAYSVLNFTYDCFGYSWHNVEVNNDHTPNDVNGCFMLVNCDANPGLFYLDTIRNLTAGKSYELSFWVANLMKPPFCNGSPVANNISIIAESLNGTILGVFNTGVVPNTNGLTWRQFALTFPVPLNQSDVVIKLVDNAGGACGNDFAMDDWVVKECGQPNAKAGFNFANFQGDTSRICISGPTSVTMTEKSTPLFSNTVYQWQESNDGGVNWIDISGATNKAYTRVYAAPDTIFFRLKLADPACIIGNKPNCFVYTNIIVLMISPGAAYTITSNSPVCKGKEIVLNATGGALSYTWTGPGNFLGSGASVSISNASTSIAGKYYVQMVSSSQCVHLDSTFVEISNAPTSNAGPDMIIAAGASTQLNGSTNITNAIYEWSPNLFIDNISIPNPTVNPPVEMPYKLTITAPGGCGSSTDEVVVKVLGAIAIPNAFTPNGDGNNDTWRIRGLSAYLKSVVAVYNRYGQLVFYQNGYDNPWDGRYQNNPLPVGTYYYTIRLGDSKSQQFKGAVTLIK